MCFGASTWCVVLPCVVCCVLCVVCCVLQCGLVLCCVAAWCVLHCVSVWPCVVLWGLVLCVAVCCSPVGRCIMCCVLQCGLVVCCVAVWFMLQRFSVGPCVVFWGLVLCIPVCCSLVGGCRPLQHTITHFADSATHCNTLLHTATLCSTLQHTARYCNTLCVHILKARALVVSPRARGAVEEGVGWGGLERGGGVDAHNLAWLHACVLVYTRAHYHTYMHCVHT